MSIAKKIWILMGLNDKEFQARMDAVVKKLQVAQSQSIRDARRLSITTQELFYGMTVPMGLFAGSVIDATKRIESLHRGLTTIAKSKGISNIEDLIRSTTELAKLPGLGLEETFAGVRNLIAVGFGAKEATEAVKGLGIGIARAGGTADHFGRVMVQLTQALAKGKLELQDFKTVFEQMPESRGILERAFGPGMSDLEKLREKGIGVRQVVQALVDGFKELGAQGFMDSLSNKIENLSDNWLKFRGALGEKVFKDQIHGILDALSNGLEKATNAINSMNPKTIELVGTIAKYVGILAIAAPATTFIAKTWFLLKGTIAGLVAGFMKLNPWLKTISLSFIGIDIVGKAFVKNWKGITAETWDIVKGIVGALSYLVKASKNAAADLVNNRDLTKLGSLPLPPSQDGRLQAMKQRGMSGNGLGFLKQWKDSTKVMDDLAKSTEKVEDKFKDLYEAQDKLMNDRLDDWEKFKQDRQDKIYQQLTTVSDLFMKHGDIAAGLAASDPLGNMSSYEMGQVLFADDTKLSQVTAVIDKLKEMKQALSEIFAGPIAQGVIGVADAFGTFVDTALKGAPDAFGAMAKALGQAVKQMIVDLVKLIAKLAIAYALFSIFAPAGAAKGLKGFFDFAKGGQGFLGGLLKGITGFAEGGVVGGNSYYGDKIMARVNSGELILNKRQQAAMYNQMNSSAGSLFIRGELRARGRDLVYVLEENQVQLNSAR